MGLGDNSEVEKGWRVVERYCIDHRAAYDMEEIIENVFMRATEFMHDSGLRMDEDFVDKLQDLYLWCSVGREKDWGLWGCPMRFTTGCPCAILITETKKYLILQFHGYHSRGCHSNPKLNGRKSAPALAGFKSYYGSGGDTEKGGSGTSTSSIHFLDPHPLNPPHGRADGDQCRVLRAASNVACNIMYASVVGGPVMDLLRHEGLL